MAAWEAVRLIKALGIVPERTVRVVGWVSEENGGAGAIQVARRPSVGPTKKNKTKTHTHECSVQYAQDHANETTVLAIESDDGINEPVGIAFAGTDSAYAALVDIAQLLALLQTNQVTRAQASGRVAAASRATESIDGR